MKLLSRVVVFVKVVCAKDFDAALWTPTMLLRMQRLRYTEWRRKEDLLYSAVFYTADKRCKKTLSFCVSISSTRAHKYRWKCTRKDTHCYECSVCSFSVLVSSRWRSYARAWAPEEKLHVVFGVFSTSILVSQKSFKNVTFYTFSLSSGRSSSLTQQRFL